MEKKQNWYSNPRKYHFIYKTTCNVNGKYYFGMHSTDDLEDGYIGSGTYLWHSIKKHGRESFSIEILEFCSDRESLKKREAELVNENLLKDSQCMNLTYGGGSGWDLINKTKSPEERSRCGKLGGYANMPFEKRSKHAKIHGKQKFTKMWEIDSEKAESYRILAITKAATPESVEKRKETFSKIEHQQGNKNSQYGTCWITNGKISKKIKLSELENIDSDWYRGRKLASVDNANLAQLLD